MSRARRLLAAMLACLAIAGCASQGQVIPETAFLSRPLSLRPGDEDATRLISDLEIKGDWNGLSALALQHAGRKPGGDDDWLVVLGYARMRSGDYPRALEVLQRVADRIPEDPDPRNLMGESLRLSGKVDQAIQVLEKSVVAHPNNHHGWYLLGEAYADANRLERAKQAYRDAVRLEPEYATGWFGLAAVLARVGPKDEYDEVLQRLEGMRPDLAQEHLKAVAARKR